MKLSIDQALEAATPDRFGARWAVAYRGGRTYVVCDLQGERTCARQWKSRGYTCGQTLKEVPSGLTWAPMDLQRAEPRGCRP